ncbi:MAG: hypothetical protein ACTHLA_11330 [Asticcacaulis sp.]|uniref:hypothetical protein n=1 Tax=Asticcacaulis sp. TaxID=1872648 RepID=UPI003F7CB0D5
MSWLHNLLSSLIAFLMAVVLAHFGAHGQSSGSSSGDPGHSGDAPAAHRPPQDSDHDRDRAAS